MNFKGNEEKGLLAIEKRCARKFLNQKAQIQS
jgi:hypothetical protein